MDKKMKIAYCIGSLAKPGGTERVLASKVNYMVDKLGYDVHILIIDQHRAPLCYDFSPNIHIHDMNTSSLQKGKTIPGLTYWMNVFRIRKLYDQKFKEIKPDVILAVERGYHDYVIPYISPGIPKVREFHFSKGAVRLRAKLMKSFKTRIRYKILYAMLYKQFKKYNRLVLLTQGDQDAENYGNNTIVVENMIEAYPKTSSLLNEKKVISIGSMNDDRKGFDKQIKIWKTIVKSFPDWTLDIYGDGIRFSHYKKMIEEEQLQNKVILHGRSNEIPQKLKESSIFIMTSEAEGLPMVLIEAMSSGLPCVSYDCPTGPSDIIKDGEDGYLIKLNDESSFKEKLQELMANEKLRKEMGTKARKNAKRYLPENIMPKWEKLFQELTGKS
ncbi:glycosyltransferase involved in cell wall biosynthesis [Aquimarina sp. MAR_2010_214]|uniref:glycosyltransferase family 4 protein n=1 Tax=Aquimarina sp. MAR_2010_214 TaxID=1250026 RepID=UPI000C6FD3BF|nr:glycosyltransferase family 4 protein [Aquimarina sp. MAR_2010_214]PKV50975.1 glycosyltransferase involved in cell wall biosynthesis [Aquimarina sp. MAR_2010_214]